MQTGHTFTTPFGRRPLSLGMLATQANARDIDPETSIDKWKLLRSIGEARLKLGISDRALVVLNALLTFYPDTDLSQANGLVVFPSNAQLSLRAHGMAPATLRRHLAALIECGLLFRKDSPNGKRFSRKARGADTAGQGAEAFGFSIAPLISRAGEFDALAEEARSERRQLKLMKEQVTLLRRDIDKLIELGAELLPAMDWQAKYALFCSVVAQLPRLPTIAELEPVLDGLECLHLEISKLLENHLKSQKMSATESHFERHKQNSNTQFDSDLEPRFGEKQGQTAAANPEPAETANVDLRAEHQTVRPVADPILLPDETGPAEKPVPLGLVLKACPDIADYARGGVASWRDLMAAAVVVRSMLGVSPSAYEDACLVLGQERAAVVVACILQRAEHIKSAGGYLRNLTEKARNEAFSVWPMLLAQLRANGGHLAVVPDRA